MKIAKWLLRMDHINQTKRKNHFHEIILVVFIPANKSSSSTIVTFELDYEICDTF